MIERQQLLQALDRLGPDDEVVLATVVKVEGSAYRRPGARMLIPRYGNAVGTLSGGCLESEVSKKAWWLTENGRAVVCRYSTASMAVDGETLTDEEAELTFGLGCNGTVHVLLERLSLATPPPQIQLLRAVEQSGQPAAMAVVFAKSGELAANIGDRLAISPSGDQLGGFTEPALSVAVAAELQQVLAQQQSRLSRYHGNTGQVELLLEYLPAPRQLVVIGAGHDAVPLVRLAALMGWRVTVIDGRQHFARPERFPDAERVLCAKADQLDERYLQPNLQPALIPQQAAVVVMTHSFQQDRAWLQQLLRRPPRYLGQLGPRSRTTRLLTDFVGTPVDVDDAMAVLHAPVGLDLGGSTPEEIALAILAEVQAAWQGRDGAMLKFREAPIHLAEPEQDHGLHTVTAPPPKATPQTEER